MNGAKLELEHRITRNHVIAAVILIGTPIMTGILFLAMDALPPSEATFTREMGVWFVAALWAFVGFSHAARALALGQDGIWRRFWLWFKDDDSFIHEVAEMERDSNE